MKTFYEMKKHFFAHKRELTELQRAINSRDKEEIQKLIRQHYIHLQKIYQLSHLLND
jgi:hypothetical protein